MSRCPSNPAKHRRTSQGHGKDGRGSPLNPHKLPLKKHQWEGHGDERVCVHCGAKPKRTRGAVVVNKPYYMDPEFQTKFKPINDEVIKNAKKA